MGSAWVMSKGLHGAQLPMATLQPKYILTCVCDSFKSYHAHDAYDDDAFAVCTLGACHSERGQTRRMLDTTLRINLEDFTHNSTSPNVLVRYLLSSSGMHPAQVNLHSGSADSILLCQDSLCFSWQDTGPYA